ncbi:hypothetical protein [Rhodococcus sp. T7]|uniref:hypothetical protein n=1 Tax=Rhodococcus sp. T7 TaxID=627444 RepID=UPI00135A7430|nr:hypothetical protein [Rhodococcus sp. T7]
MAENRTVAVLDLDSGAADKTAAMSDLYRPRSQDASHRRLKAAAAAITGVAKDRAAPTILPHNAAQSRRDCRVNVNVNVETTALLPCQRGKGRPIPLFVTIIRQVRRPGQDLLGPARLYGEISQAVGHASARSASRTTAARAAATLSV